MKHESNNPRLFWLIFCGAISGGVAGPFYAYKQTGDREGLVWELIGIACFIIITVVLYVLNIVLFEPIARRFRKRGEKSTETKM